MFKRLLFVLSGLANLGILSVTAQTLDPTFTLPQQVMTPGYVTAFGPAQADGKRVVFGYFTSANGQIAGSIARFDDQGRLDEDFTLNAATARGVRRIYQLPTGQYLLGSQGGALSAATLTRTSLLRLQADGSADPSFDVGTGPTRGSLGGAASDYAVMPDGKVVAAGSFDAFSGTAAAGVVRLDAQGKVDPTFTVTSGVAQTPNAAVYALAAQPDSKVLVGGFFSAFGGVAANSLVRLDANGHLDPTFTSGLPPDLQVLKLLLQPDGRVLVQGVADYVNFNGYPVVLRLLANGSLDNSFALPPALLRRINPLFDAPTPMVLQPDGKLVVIGDFALPGYPHVARLLPSGALDASFQLPTGGPDATPYAVGVQPSGTILLGGRFHVLAGRETSVGQLSSSGLPLQGFALRLELPGTAYALARQPDGALLVGGDFSSWNGAAVHRVVRLSSTGQLDTAFVRRSRALVGEVGALALQPDGGIVVGAGYRVRRLLPDGRPDPNFSFYRQAMASRIVPLPDGSLLVGGLIGETDTLSGYHYDLIHTSATGALDASFKLVNSASLDRLFDFVRQPDGRLLVAAHYYEQSNENTRLVRYEANGSLDASYARPLIEAGNYFSSINCLKLQNDGSALLAGFFTTVAGQPRNGLARVLPDGAPAPDFGTLPLLKGDAIALAVQPNGRVLVGGTFLSIAAPVYRNLLRLLPNGQLDTSFANTATSDNDVEDLLVQPDGGIVMAGGFTAVGTTHAETLARLLASNVLAVPAPAAPASFAVWPVPARSVLHASAEAGAQGAELLDALGRVVRRQALGGAGEFSVPTEGLPAGVYVLRVRYASGSVARRVAVE